MVSAAYKASQGNIRSLVQNDINRDIERRPKNQVPPSGTGTTFVTSNAADNSLCGDIDVGGPNRNLENTELFLQGMVELKDEMIGMKRKACEKM